MPDSSEGSVSFRPLSRADLTRLQDWLAAPHVMVWWKQSAELPALEAKYGPRIDGREPCEVFVIELDQAPVGLIQRYRVTDYPGWETDLSQAFGFGPSAGIDYLIGEPSKVSKGLGARAIRAFSLTVFERYPEIGSIIVAPQQANIASWRVLEKAGYRRIWAGQLESDDPSDAGLSYAYVLRRAGVSPPTGSPHARLY